MGTFAVGRYAVSIGAAAVLLAACGALRQAQDDMQPPIGAPAIRPEIETAVTGPAAKICGVEILHAFTGDHGYGTTYSGGANGMGTVFKISTTGQVPARSL